MKVLFARVGYMKYYRGPRPGDEKPIGGGDYNVDGIGSEVYNFLPIDGLVYGYFQPNMQAPYEINLSRIEKGCVGEKIDGVLVIWFATNPVARGQVVIGWYKNATVYRAARSGDDFLERDGRDYYVMARAEDATLLPISKRGFPVGHDMVGVKKGKPGEANTFYVLDKSGQPKNSKDPHNAWIKEVISYVNAYNGASITSDEDALQEDLATASQVAKGQGFQSDVQARLNIEAHAMAACRAHYEIQGYTVEDVSLSHPFDFKIKKGRKEFMVEVKGTQGDGSQILLTRNEVSLSREDGKRMILFVLHDVVLNKSGVKKNSGIKKIIEPWQVSETSLKPISYVCDLSLY